MKKILLSILVSIIWFISFWYSQYLWLDFITTWNRVEIPAWWTSVQVDLSTLNNWSSITKWMPYCMHYRVTRLSNWNYVNATANAFSFIFSIWPVSDYYWWFTKIRYVPSNWMYQWFVCWYVISQWTLSYLTWNFTEQSNSYSVFVDYEIYKNNWFVDLGWSCTNYTSEECQSEYSLMPISSCDSEFCQLNGMCFTWSSWSWDLQRSALFINWIQHVGGSIIDVTIPSEIQRNYIYTWENEETFKLDVVWLNGDPDYIQWIIDVNSYRPTSEDFTQTFVWGLTLVFPYIIITAIVLFIWRFIRNIFK